MNRYETSSIASEISFKHFNCYRLSVQDKPSLWETSHDSNLNLCPTRLATELLIFATDTQEVWYSIDLLSLLLRATYK